MDKLFELTIASITGNRATVSSTPFDRSSFARIMSSVIGAPLECEKFQSLIRDSIINSANVGMIIMKNANGIRGIRPSLMTLDDIKGASYVEEDNWIPWTTRREKKVAPNGRIFRERKATTRGWMPYMCKIE